MVKDMIGGGYTIFLPIFPFGLAPSLAPVLAPAPVIVR
jgi:hypothetical protein